MFSAAATISYPSSDFISLCQSQITLLAKILQADWSAVYLTSEKDNQQISLIPIVVYPSNVATEIAYSNQSDLTKEKKISRIPILRKSLPFIFKNLPAIKRDNLFLSEPYQIGFPLIYGGIVLGVLVTRRLKYPWKQDELNQIRKIANTLAIARSLDQRQTFFKKQLQQQKLLQRQEYDRIEDLFHQLRNPLTALKIFSKLLLKRLVSDKQSSAVVKNMIREGEHLNELIKEFEINQASIGSSLDTFSLNSTSIPINSVSSLSLPRSLKLSKIYISEVLENILISMKPIAQSKKIILRTEIPKNLEPILANAFGLREVISNLIDNSIKYTSSLGQIEIKLGLFKVINNKKYQGICIQDTGLGISPEDQLYIFERHYRGIQTQENISGNGLGLAIVQELVDKMNGIIELLSPTDPIEKRGTQFIIWLLVEDSTNI